MPKKIKMNPIHLVGGEKGGVGKTFVSRSLCQYLKTQGTDFLLVEADSQINDVGRIYSSEASGTETITLSDDPDMQTEPDVIIDMALQHPVLVNLPSNTLDVLENWIGRFGLKYIQEEHGGKNYFIKWFVSDGCHESIRQLERSINQLDNAIPHVVVLNKGRLIGRDFSYLENAETYKSIRQAPNFVGEVEFPAMESAVQFFIDSKELTLEEAKELIQADMGVMAKQRVKTFIDEISECFAAGFEALQKKDFLSKPTSNGSNGSSGQGFQEESSGEPPEDDPTRGELQGQNFKS